MPGQELEFAPPSASDQVSFYYRLLEIRQTYLRQALESAVGDVELSALDKELRKFVDRRSLQRVARKGLRGEVVFAVPLILQRSPFLLGYYRLLYGVSQKEFYHKGPFGRFKRLESHGELTTRIESQLPSLCTSLAVTGRQLVDGLDDLSMSVIHDLQLLTVGPQLRGSANNTIGGKAVASVKQLIESIVAGHMHETTETAIRIVNAAGRSVLIEFGADPDVKVTEKVDTRVRFVLSIEVKGGADASNVYNRLGEAEKSHLKVKRLGCNELWTILRVDIPESAATAGSPTTTRFFHLDRICDAGSAEHAAFCSDLRSVIGI